MKINRKTVLSTAAVLGVAALIAGGTIAYFTDNAEKENKFVVGDIEVELFESQLHRENSGRTGAFAASASDPHYCDWINVHAVTGSTIDGNTGAGPQNGNYDSARYCTPEKDANNTEGITAVENGHTRTGFPTTNRTWGYSDATIESDAAAYENGYFADVAKNIVPGEWVRKFSYAKNTGNNDAYILIRYMIPTEYEDNVVLKVPGTPYEEDVHADISGHQGYFTALTKDNDGKYVAFDASEKDAMDDYEGYVETIDNVEYRIFAAVTTDVVNPGEMTFWSPVNTVKLNNIETESTVEPATQINVKVDAQAVQAKTFADALTAIKAGALK